MTDTADLHRSLWVDPIGWDRQAGKVHDCEPTPYGLLHFSTCWCRHVEGRKVTDE